MFSQILSSQWTNVTPPKPIRMEINQHIECAMHNAIVMPNYRINKANYNKAIVGTVE